MTSSYFVITIEILYSGHTVTLDADGLCTNQMKAFLTTANGCTNWYDYKWILPNILKVP